MRRVAVLALLLSFAALGMASAPAAMAATSAGGATRASAPAAAVSAHAVTRSTAARSAHRRITSSWVVYSGTSFTGTARDIHGCGVHNRPYPVNSYKWFARGQSGRMYNCFNAQCAVNVILGAGTNASQSTPVGWKSIDIIC